MTMMLPHKDTPVAEHVPAEWRSKIMHARLIIGDHGGLGMTMFSDCGRMVETASEGGLPA
jgi:uncharacterized glyoxalase superfamily protein PhnB